MGSPSRGRTQAGYTSPFEASGWTRRVSRRALRWALSEAGQVPPHGMTKASSHAAARAATAQRSTRLDRGYALTLQVTENGTNVTVQGKRSRSGARWRHGPLPFLLHVLLWLKTDRAS